MKAIRHYNAAGHLVGYADANYAFVCERNSSGEMIGYANSKGEKSGTLAK